MQISAGSCLLPDGVLIIENEIKSLVIPISSLATDYTVIYQLEDTVTLGGSPAILRLLSGIKRQEDFTDATILGWIRYQGGSVPLSSSFFIQPSSLRIARRADAFSYINHCPLTAIRSQSNMTVPSSSVNITTNAFTTTTPMSNDWAVTVATTGTLPAPLSSSTVYYIVNATSSTFQLSLTLGGPPIDLTSTGTGTHSFSGMWTESLDYVLNEACSRFVNASSVPSSYTLRFPFVVSSFGQPQKVVTRLLVDFSCLVTYAINVQGTIVELTPNGGLVSNTGTIITREFNVPNNDSIVWNAGSTSYIEVTIDAQPSRGASIAYVGLTLEPTPFTLFTS
jgi:hypothetical protein